MFVLATPSVFFHACLVATVSLSFLPQSNLAIGTRALSEKSWFCD